MKLTQGTTGWKVEGKLEDGRSIEYGVTTNARGSAFTYVYVEGERQRKWSETSHDAKARMLRFLKQVLGVATPKAPDSYVDGGTSGDVSSSEAEAPTQRVPAGVSVPPSTKKLDRSEEPVGHAFERLNKCSRCEGDLASKKDRHYHTATSFGGGRAEPICCKCGGTACQEQSTDEASKSTPATSSSTTEAKSSRSSRRTRVSRRKGSSRRTR